VEQLKDSTKLKDFENIDNSVFLRFMSSIHGFGSKRDGVFKLRNLSSQDLDVLGQRVKTSVERAIDFLSTDLLVPSDAFLPYENQLVVSAYVFSKNLNPSSEQLSALRRWFWQSGFSERYRGAVEEILEQDLAAADNLLKGDPNAMTVKVSLVENDILKRQFWKNSAFSKTFVVMLANRAPRNLTNGEAIDIRLALSSFNNKEFHHIFPKDFLRKLGVGAEKRNAIANICMFSGSQNRDISNDPPSSYLVKSYDVLGQEAETVFNSNLISGAAGSPWRVDNYEGFLRERANNILSEILSVWGVLGAKGAEQS
jgi:hypothetical protein